MCMTCGCGTGETHIEGAPHGHAHTHPDGTTHTHVHDHAHDAHDHIHEAPHEHAHVHADGSSHTHAHVHPHDHVHDAGAVHTHADGSTHSHPHEHAHEHAGHLHYGGGAAGAAAPGMTQARMVQIERDILAKNDDHAQRNRGWLAEHGIFALNLVSSPGSGKTTLLVETLKALAGLCPAAVVEGDQQTSLDADRIAATGAPVVQLNTGKGCHLDAHQVGHAAESLPLQRGGILFIENVGNLVCPAAFDLGEAHKVVVLSVTEGDDKPLKYPDMFRAADLCLITKSDLLPYVPFDVARATANAMRINPALECLTLSVMSGAGFDAWLAWLRREVAVRARMSGPLAVTDAGARA